MRIASRKSNDGIKPHVLVDSGPLIALFDRDDAHHQKVMKFMKTFRGSLVTTWPVLTEVMYMLDFHPQVPVDFLRWVDDGGVILYQLETEHLARIRELHETYRDLPSDLADVSLIAASEFAGIDKILSIDSDFSVYRTIKGLHLENVLLTQRP